MYCNATPQQRLFMSSNNFTLLHTDVLAFRKTAGELSGQILIGGKPPSRAFMRRYTGYVEQFGAQTALLKGFHGSDQIY